jgi:hypothetical protein
MTESPKRPYLFTIFGGEGEREQDPKAGEQQQELSPEEQAAKEVEERLTKAEQAAKEADKRAKDAEKKLQEKEREGMEDFQRTEAERDDFKDKYEKLLKIVETSYLDTAIMKAKGLKFRDPEGVRAFLDHESISVDLDTGDIKGLDNELKRIAKDKPYLLVPTEGEGQQGGEHKPPPGPPTGNSPVGGSVRQRETDRGKIGVKYNIPGFRGATNVANTRPL